MVIRNQTIQAFCLAVSGFFDDKICYLRFKPIT